MVLPCRARGKRELRLFTFQYSDYLFTKRASLRIRVVGWRLDARLRLCSAHTHTHTGYSRMCIRTRPRIRANVYVHGGGHGSQSRTDSARNVRAGRMASVCCNPGIHLCVRARKRVWFNATTLLNRGGTQHTRETYRFVSAHVPMNVPVNSRDRTRFAAISERGSIVRRTAVDAAVTAFVLSSLSISHPLALGVT